MQFYKEPTYEYFNPVIVNDIIKRKRNDALQCYKDSKELDPMYDIAIPTYTTIARHGRKPFVYGWMIFKHGSDIALQRFYNFLVDYVEISRKNKTEFFVHTHLKDFKKYWKY